VEQIFFVVDEALPHRLFVLPIQIMKHTIFSYRGILSLNDESHVPGLMARPEQETIVSNHEDNEPQRYSSDKSSNAYNSDDEVDYADVVHNINFTSDKNSQIESRQLMYKFIFTIISYISTPIVVIIFINNLSYI
jgi:hypothetical protein